MGTITISQVWGWILAGAAALVSITKAYEIVKKWGKGDVIKMLENDDKRIKKLEEMAEEEKETNKIVLQALLAIVNHSIDGNGIEGLKNIRDNLQDHLIKH